MNQRTGFRALAVNLRALASCFLFLATPLAAEPSFDVIRDEIANHPGQTGAFVLDTGEEALLARAWLVNHAESSIEVQYFILSTDNVGILASEALLRATCQKNSRPQYVTRSKGHRNLSRATPPVFALHAETVVVDGEITYIGSFNLDPRSQNLSTEVGLVVRAPMFARRVQTAIEEDMLPANS